MRPKKDIAKDQMDMAPYRKGGHTRRYAEGGDIENDEDVPARKVERIGKSALEEGEPKDISPDRNISFKEAFKANRAIGNKTFEWQGRTYTTDLAKSAKSSASATAPDYGDETSRMTARSPARTPVRDAGAVPVGGDERTPRADTRPQARQPSKLERMVDALPVGKIGAGLGAVAGAAGTAYAGYKAAQRLKAAKQMRDAELMRQYKGAEAINRDRMGAAADALKRERRSSSPSLLRSQENFSSGGSVSSASSRADGIAQKGKTKGKVI